MKNLSQLTLIFVLVSLFGLETILALLSQAGRNNLIRQAEKISEGSKEESEVFVSEFERRLLNMFGLKRRPNPGKNPHIPRLMQHLYKAHMGELYRDQYNLDGSWEPGFDLPSPDITSRVNTARSFHHIDTDEHLPGLPDHHIRLRFNLSTLPEEEVIGAAELLLHREAVSEHLQEQDSPIHRINIYEIMKIREDLEDDAGATVNNRFGSRVITRLLDTRLIDISNTTWEKFDVSLPTVRWAQGHHNDNHGLLVEVLSEDGSHPPTGERKNHVRLKRDLHREFSDREWLDKRPTLLTYTNDGRDTTLRRRTRAKRNSRKRDVNSSRKKRKKKKKNRPCSRHNLYVDFSEVGWNDWIVAPHGYDAFYCQGQCLFPLAEHLNATNHAIVQTLANSVHPVLAPKPCCVPTELSSIAMLYLDEYDLVVLRSYQHMVVEACGCR